MLVVGFPAGPWQTNCWVIAPDRGEQCVVIDPGHGAEAPLDDVLAEHGLQPVAVLLTHGHVDHMWSVVPVCGAKDVPALIHPADRSMLTDPGVAVGLPPGTPILGRLDWSEPDDVRLLHDGERLDLAGMTSVGRRRAASRLLVTSSLFGVVGPADRIPAYRLAGAAS